MQLQKITQKEILTKKAFLTNKKTLVGWRRIPFTRLE